MTGLASIWQHALACSLLLLSGSTRAEEPVDFNRDIRPLLANNCFACHGPDEAKREAELRLDRRDAALAELPTGSRAIVPQDIEASELVARIASDDPDLRMPPADSGKSLTPAQIELFTRWVAQGAEYALHWSLVPPRRPMLPEDEEYKHPADRLLVAKLKRLSQNSETPSPGPFPEDGGAGLRLSPRADEVTLVRRLYFDLLGLPPDARRVEQFLADDRPLAYEQLVDELLASPHFGERMAMYWLDLVRYADTNGYHGDNYRSVWPYRDYVIRAFNLNKPFDEFTIEQLAGDLLPDATQEQRVASAYNRLNMITAEGGSQAKEYLAKYAADRVRTTATVWMGMTLGCAQCHDHKFDPFTAEDFYSFASYFADIQERGVYNFTEERWDPEMPVPSPKQAAQQRQLETGIAAAERKLAEETPDLTAAREAWEREQRDRVRADELMFTALRPRPKKSAFGTKLKLLEDNSLLAIGAKVNNEVYLVNLQVGPEPITAIQLEALTHPSLTNGSLSHANGNFVLTGFEVEVAGPAEPRRKVAIANVVADYAAKDHPIEHAIDQDTNTGWSVDGHQHALDRRAIFTFGEPLRVPEGGRLIVRLRHESIYPVHNIGRFRLSVTSNEKPGLPSHGLPDDITHALQAEPAARTAAQNDLLAAHFRQITPLLETGRVKLKSLRDEQAELAKGIPTVLVSVSVEPRETRLLPRGNWLDGTGPVVQPHVPAVFAIDSSKPQQRETRLDLARWFVSPKNPLTARVFVNRVWKLLFGRGLATPLDDLGTQGTPPLHEDVLDWLAVEFRESGWDVKHLVRLIVTSQAYQQSSTPTEAQLERDPLNLRFARQSRFRFDAEVVRDNALCVSGLWNPAIGGPSVKPYQPAGYWSQLNFPEREWEADTGPNLYRRGLYTYWMRTFLHPSMLAFDAPNREESTCQRERSTTPLQSLALLNDPTYVEAARVFAQRILTDGGIETSDRISWAYREVLSREPASAICDELRALFEQDLREYQSDPVAATELIKIGATPVPTTISPAELAAWTSVARVLLNLHETITRY